MLRAMNPTPLTANPLPEGESVFSVAVPYPISLTPRFSEVHGRVSLAFPVAR